MKKETVLMQLFKPDVAYTYKTPNDTTFRIIKFFTYECLLYKHNEPFSLRHESV